MAKNYSFRKRTRKSLIAALCAVSVTCTGLAAACTHTDDEDKKPTPPVKEDTQLLKNGNFEFFTVPEDGVYLINNVSDWSLSGDSSVKSGIIGTSKAAWDKHTDENLASTLDYNNDLSTSDEDYVDYNSMRSADILYKDSYAALLKSDDVKDSWIKNQGYESYFGITGSDEDGYKLGTQTVYKNADDGEFYFDEDFTKCVRQELLANPGTHLGNYEQRDGKHYYGNTQVYADDDGNLFEDEDKENSVGNVLMIHNYTTDGKNNGLQQSYSSTSISLEANTSAEISLWVKTSNLKFDKGYSAIDEQDKGAFIDVVHSVSGNSLDSFSIKSINTEKILAQAEKDGVTTTASNGWIKYTVYVNGCDFAASTIQLRLGLGNSGEDEKCTGYAFFDDVTVTKYRSLDSEGCTYKENSQKIKDANTAATLMNEGEEKQFIADAEMRISDGTDKRHAYDFYYALDLASEIGDRKYQGINFNRDNSQAGLTTQESEDKLYATSLSNGATLSDIAEKALDENVRLMTNVDERYTDKGDLLGTFNLDHRFTASEFKNTNQDYAKLLNDALLGEDNTLPDASGNMIVMFSAWGAAYTTTVNQSTGETAFVLEGDEYKLISFWVKTSDMDGVTPLTAKIYDKNDDENTQSITVNSTGVKTNFEDDEDIYNGWVQCFAFVKNETDKKAEFNLDFCLGNTDIVGAKSYPGGWAAIADLKILDINEDVYKLATSGERTMLLDFTSESTDESGFEFDATTGISDIRNEISQPSKYNGYNGANSMITETNGNFSFDGLNTNKLAGLVNKDYAENYDTWNLIASAFKAEANWNAVFGEECYQPLIIINNLRAYADKAGATEDTVTNYYVVAEHDYSGAVVTTADGKIYRKATKEDWDNKTDDTVFYSLNSNYGFAGEAKTVSANSYETISIKVKVSEGAQAYIYLVDANDTRKLLGYETPAYSFYYDEEGNVLDKEFDSDWKEAEHREHIVYKVRNDGLYENEDGKVFANLYNLDKSFKNYKYEHNTFYNADGEPVSFDKLVDGETYYSDKEATKVADHYLVSTNGTRVFECVDGTYYYLEVNKDGKLERTTEVNNFDSKLAAETSWNKQFFATVGDTHGEWETVNFFIHTGSESKKYRLELWSGDRTKTGVDNDGNFSSGAVAFDYSAYSITSSNYSTLVGEYEDKVVEAFRQKLIEKDKLDVIPSNNENISYFEQQLVEDGVLTQTEVDEIKSSVGYEAKYHTYNLYDSKAYIPFNQNTANEGETGYAYKVTDFSETLAYFNYRDEAQNSQNVFIDYSAVDQSITLNTDSGSDDGNTDEEEETNNFGDLMLYIASIILVVVLLFTLVVLFVRSILKNIKKNNPTNDKPTYRQRKRYVKKVSDNADAEENASEAAEEEATEQAPVEEPQTEETPVEETATPVEEVPAEETPVEESTTETPDDGEKSE